MKFVRCSVILSVCLLGATAERAGAVDLLYDFEGDSGTTATDKLSTDGAQNGAVYNNVILNNTTDPGFGTQTAFFDSPPLPISQPYSTFEIPSTTFGANYSVTLAGWVNQDQVNTGLRRFRVFSSFSGTGGVANILMLDASNASGSSSIRGIVGGVQFNGANNVGALTPGYHHYAMTVDGSIMGNSAVKLYVDGSPVTISTTGTLAAGYVNNANLRIGEDTANFPTTNSAAEQLVGNADDMLVLGRALAAADIAALYNAGTGAPVSSIVTPSASELGVYYDFEGDTGNNATDKFTLDDSQNSVGTQTAMADANAAHAKVGLQSASFTDPRPNLPSSQLYSQINAGAVGNLGPNFTLSAVVNPYSTGQYSGGIERVFSSYAGTGSTAGSLILDFNPATTTGIRLFLPSNTNAATLTVAGPGKPDSVITTKQTLTVVYETGAVNDSVRLYLDGVQIGAKLDLPPGTVQSLGANDLRIGEDRGSFLGAFANENFIGSMDDVMILSRALTPAQVSFLHSNGAAALVASLKVAGDYNGNGVVDGADYVVWRKSAGQTGAGLAADGNGDNTVNNDDFTYWRARYGNTAGAGSDLGDSGAVPEPRSLVMAGLGIVGVTAFRGRRRIW
jgi:hypothetical protein